MKIRDKRSAYFRLDGTDVSYPNLRFIYVDEIPGGERGAMFVGLDSTVGEKLNHSYVKKIDADRPFMLFTGNANDAAPTLYIYSSTKVTYTGTKTTGANGDGSSALIIPGIKCGDFVKISTKQ